MDDGSQALLESDIARVAINELGASISSCGESL